MPMDRRFIPESVMPSARHFPDLHFSVVEAVAQAWAKMGGLLKQYRLGAEENPFQTNGGLRYAYIHDAAKLLRELKEAGLEVIPEALPMPPLPKLKRIRDRKAENERRKVKLTPGKLKGPDVKNPVAVMPGWKKPHEEYTDA